MKKKSVIWTGSGKKNSGETGLKGLDEEPGTVYATTVQRNRISSGIIYDCKLKLKNLWKKKLKIDLPDFLSRFLPRSHFCSTLPTTKRTVPPCLLQSAALIELL